MSEVERDESPEARYLRERRARLTRLVGAPLRTPKGPPTTPERLRFLREEAEELYWNELAWEKLTDEEMIGGSELVEYTFPAFLAFVDGAELVIHNAAFDMGFLEHELSLLGERYGRLRDRVTVLDSLELARQRYPGQRNSLDALCRRLGVDNSHRQLHGALLDAQLLAEAWLALTAGQGEIGFASSEPAPSSRAGQAAVAIAVSGPRPSISVPDEDRVLHLARVEAIRKKAGRCVWDVPEPELAQAATG